MPNCDFYAVEQDLIDVLAFVFDELEVRVFESYSMFDQELAEFHGMTDVLARFPHFGRTGGPKQDILLQLWPGGASDAVVISRIDLNPQVCQGGRFRYCIEGWGLIQLYIRASSDVVIRPSHTNHNSAKRAEKWAGAYPGLGDPSRWDFMEVTRVSRRLNKFIASSAVRKEGSRSVLRCADAAVRAGARLALNS